MIVNPSRLTCQRGPVVGSYFPVELCLLRKVALLCFHTGAGLTRWSSQERFVGQSDTVPHSLNYNTLISLSSKLEFFFYKAASFGKPLNLGFRYDTRRLEPS